MFALFSSIICCFLLVCAFSIDEDFSVHHKRLIPPTMRDLYDNLVTRSEGGHFSIPQLPVEVTSLGHAIKLKAPVGDDSISRLKEEFADRSGRLQDTYGLHNISAKTPLVMDIGGNIGFISILITKVHPQAQVIVFEPNPRTYFFLRLNMFLNHVPVLSAEELMGKQI